MVNYNGNFCSPNSLLTATNRGFQYGDGVFETLKIIDNRILFLEDHYFRLMSSMRILRMEIPMNFTMEFFEQEILTTIEKNNCTSSARVRITVFRNEGGLYLPETNEISYLIQCFPLTNTLYELDHNSFEVELYKDGYVSNQILSNLKTTNRIINTLASIFAQENGYQTCLLINESKNIAEAIQGNLFMVLGNVVTTPPLSEGCIKGIMRKQLIEIIQKNTTYEFKEIPISPFDLQKADELFFTNVIKGIQPITKYRKKEFQHTVANDLMNHLNVLIQ